MTDNNGTGHQTPQEKWRWILPVLRWLGLVLACAGSIMIVSGEESMVRIGLAVTAVMVGVTFYVFVTFLIFAGKVLAGLLATRRLPSAEEIAEIVVRRIIEAMEEEESTLPPESVPTDRHRGVLGDHFVASVPFASGVDEYVQLGFQLGQTKQAIERLEGMHAHALVNLQEAEARYKESQEEVEKLGDELGSQALDKALQERDRVGEMLGRAVTHLAQSANLLARMRARWDDLEDQFAKLGQPDTTTDTADHDGTTPAPLLSLWKELNEPETGATDAVGDDRDPTTASEADDDSDDTITTTRVALSDVQEKVLKALVELGKASQVVEGLNQKLATASPDDVGPISDAHFEASLECEKLCQQIDSLRAEEDILITELAERGVKASPAFFHPRMFRQAVGDDRDLTTADEADDNDTTANEPDGPEFTHRRFERIGPPEEPGPVSEDAVLAGLNEQLYELKRQIDSHEATILAHLQQAERYQRDHDRLKKQADDLRDHSEGEDLDEVKVKKAIANLRDEANEFLGKAHASKNAAQRAREEADRLRDQEPEVRQEIEARKRELGIEPELGGTVDPPSSLYADHLPTSAPEGEDRGEDPTAGSSESEDVPRPLRLYPPTTPAEEASLWPSAEDDDGTPDEPVGDGVSTSSISGYPVVPPEAVSESHSGGRDAVMLEEGDRRVLTESGEGSPTPTDEVARWSGAQPDDVEGDDATVAPDDDLADSTASSAQWEAVYEEASGNHSAVPADEPDNGVARPPAVDEAHTPTSEEFAEFFAEEESPPPLSRVRPISPIGAPLWWPSDLVSDEPVDGDEPAGKGE